MNERARLGLGENGIEDGAQRRDPCRVGVTRVKFEVTLADYVVVGVVFYRARTPLIGLGKGEQGLFESRAVASTPR